MEFLFEIIIQIIGELLFEGLFRVFREPFQSRPRPVLLVIPYALAGVLFGGLSVWLLPQGFLPTETLRIGYLILAPLALGLLMLQLRPLVGIRTEWSPALQVSTTAIFAFAFALVRYLSIY